MRLKKNAPFSKNGVFLNLVHINSRTQEELSSVLPPVMSLLNSTASSVIQQLYDSTDFSSLNWFEQQWAAWYIWVGNPVIATGIMAFVVHEVGF